MCSICRNKNCKYQFGVESWKLDDEIVTFQLSELDTRPILEQIREREELIRKRVKGVKEPKLLKGKS